jgi:hypothetical protein
VEGKRATASVTVIPARVDITPGTATLALGGSRQLTGVAFDFEGNPISSPGVIAWSSNNLNTATISSTGLVSSVAAGNTVIAAAVAGRTATLDLEVGAPSTHDGHWTGLSTTPAVGGGTRTFPIEFDVVFGTVRAFRFSFTTEASATCAASATALSRETASIVNNTFQLPLYPTPGQPTSVSGTFTSPATMTGTHPTFSFTGLACVTPTGTTGNANSLVNPGTIAANRQ